MNLIKLCVGISSVDELIDYRAQRQSRGRADGLNVHRTRMMPRLADQISGQGSLYWVIAGAVRCRQSIIGLESATDHEGKTCCDILLDPEIVRTSPYPRRPFQGWRYLKPDDAPADLGRAGEDLPPEGMAEELAKYGLL